MSGYLLNTDGIWKEHAGLGDVVHNYVDPSGAGHLSHYKQYLDKYQYVELFFTGQNSVFTIQPMGTGASFEVKGCYMEGGTIGDWNFSGANNVWSDLANSRTGNQVCRIVMYKKSSTLYVGAIYMNVGGWVFQGWIEVRNINDLAFGNRTGTNTRYVIVGYGERT